MSPHLVYRRKPQKTLQIISRSPKKGFSWAGMAVFSVGLLAGVQKLVCISSPGGYWFEVLFVTTSFCSFPNPSSGKPE